eukprot:TRINITY_DN392_c0_g2_i2.p1 TRINITY_DN392_c0_g2~~TRINITY_DN392_c0_g2_i2.p1  ORF type:complete len:812 (+),score=316.42 TRINITY_DN392_c0_g2_i2:297-2438(+)
MRNGEIEYVEEVSEESDDESSEYDSEESSSEYDSDEETASDDEYDSAEEEETESEGDDEESNDEADDSEVMSDFADWDTDASVEDEESSEEETGVTGRDRWVKKTVQANVGALKKQEIRKQRQNKRKAKGKPVADKKVQEEVKEEEEFTVEFLDKKTMELMQARGKRGVDTEQQLKGLQELLVKSVEEEMNVKIIMTLKSLILMTRLDAASHRIDAHLTREAWLEAVQTLSDLLSMLVNNRQYHLVTVEQDVLGSSSVGGAQGIILLNANLEEETVSIIGTLESFVKFLYEDYMRHLRDMDARNDEYLVRVNDERELFKTLEVCLSYLKVHNLMVQAAKVGLLEMQLLYSKVMTQDTLFYKQIMEDRSKMVYMNLCQGADQSDNSDQLCTLINVQFLAINNRYYEARDIFAMTQAYKSDMYALDDINIQCMYNRTLVQLGLCAFRNGLFTECHRLLGDLMNTGGKMKELIAQGLFFRRGDNFKRTEEDEKNERRRRMPFHLHVNIELLELVYYTSAMLAEVKLIASGSNSIISRAFRKALKDYTNTVFDGPPENVREYTAQAGYLILHDDWKRASELLLGHKGWKLWSRYDLDTIRSQLLEEIKTVSLKVYLYLFGTRYDHLSVALLAEMFEMPVSQTTRIVNRMIFTKQVPASWLDEDLIQVNSHPSTAIQKASQSTADALQRFLDSSSQFEDHCNGRSFGDFHRHNNIFRQ